MLTPSIFEFRTGVRVLASYASRALPRETSVRVERWLRGWEEARKLPHADGVVISYAKSGRTWFRVLVSRYFAKKYGLPEGKTMEFDEFHRVNPAIPVLFFSHDNYLKDYEGHDRKAELYGRAKVILMVRDPRDTAVSQYFQWKHRISARKKILNNYPPADVGIADFVMSETAGIPKIIDFMNAWARELPSFRQLHVIRYEELKADTAGELGRALRFLGQQPTDSELADAAAFGSVENMRKMEKENAGKLLANPRLTPGDANDPASFKVRRAKVGGWRDYVSEEQADQIDTMVRDRLSPVFGYV